VLVSRLYRVAFYIVLTSHVTPHGLAALTALTTVCAGTLALDVKNTVGLSLLALGFRQARHLVWGKNEAEDIQV
jgi:hypothetical protein